VLPFSCMEHLTGSLCIWYRLHPLIRLWLSGDRCFLHYYSWCVHFELIAIISHLRSAQCSIAYSPSPSYKAGFLLGLCPNWLCHQFQPQLRGGTWSDSNAERVSGTAPHFLQCFILASVLKALEKRSCTTTSVHPSSLPPNTRSGRSLISNVILMLNLDCESLSRFKRKYDLNRP